jgi:anti-sigma B factor antagonist
MDFKVSTSRVNDGDGLLICVEGELDLGTVKRVEGAAEAAISERCPVLLDLSKCPFIDSTGLRLVLQIHRALMDGGGTSVPMAIVARSPSVRKLFSLTAIDRSIPVFHTRDEAVEALGASRERARGS